MYVETFFAIASTSILPSESGGWHQTPVMQLAGMVRGSDPCMIWNGEQERESLSVMFQAQAIRCTWRRASA